MLKSCMLKFFDHILNRLPERTEQQANSSNVSGIDSEVGSHLINRTADLLTEEFKKNISEWDRRILT